MRYLVSLFLILSANASAANVLEDYLTSLADDEVELPFSAERGQEVWYREVNGRQCTSCHLDSVYAQGRHQKTGKVIEPMAPSVNPERLTDLKKMKKWFLRNCKWTFKRECTNQEKGDVLVWLKDL